MSQLGKEIDENVCCSYEYFYQRKNATTVIISDNLSTTVWSTLKEFILEQNSSTTNLFMCNYFKYFIKRTRLQPHCPQRTTNSSNTTRIVEDRVPSSLKFYHIVVRLGTCTAKYPPKIHSSKSTMSFHPLPLEKHFRKDKALQQQCYPLCSGTKLSCTCTRICANFMLCGRP